MFWENFYNLCVQNNTKPIPVVKSLGIATGAVTKWKNGAIPNGETLIKIAEFFNCSVDYLLGKEKSAPTDLDAQLEGVDFALYGEIHDLTDSEKEDILNFIKFTKAKRIDNN